MEPPPFFSGNQVMAEASSRNSQQTVRPLSIIQMQSPMVLSSDQDGFHRTLCLIGAIVKEKKASRQSMSFQKGRSLFSSEALPHLNKAFFFFSVIRLNHRGTGKLTKFTFCSQSSSMVQLTSLYTSGK